MAGVIVGQVGAADAPAPGQPRAAAASSTCPTPSPIITTSAPDGQTSGMSASVPKRPRNRSHTSQVAGPTISARANCISSQPSGPPSPIAIRFAPARTAWSLPDCSVAPSIRMRSGAPRSQRPGAARKRGVCVKPTAARPSSCRFKRNPSPGKASKTAVVANPRPPTTARCGAWGTSAPVISGRSMNTGKRGCVTAGARWRGPTPGCSEGT